MDFELILDSLPKLGEGLLLTLQVTALSLVIGFLISLPVAIMSISSSALLKRPSEFYMFCLRGTPLLVQIFIVYYGLAQFEWIRSSPLWVFLSEPFWCAVIALSLNTSAYNAEIIRGAFLLIPKGQLDAAGAFGMSRWKTVRRIIWPQALRIGLPAYSNEVVLLLKASSLVSVITLLDLTGVAKSIIAETYKPVELYSVIAVGYFLVTVAVTSGFRKFERALTPSSRSIKSY